LKWEHRSIYFQHLSIFFNICSLVGVKWVLYIC
jgi:hypothetical protein